MTVERTEQPALPGVDLPTLESEARRPSPALAAALEREDAHELDERLTTEPTQPVVSKPAKTPRSYMQGGRRYARVTSVIGLLDKSGPLTSWAGATQLEADYEAAMVAFQVTPAGAKLEAFKDAMRESLINTWGVAYRKADWTEDRPRLAHAVRKETAADAGTLAHGLLEWHVNKLVGVPDLGPEPQVSEEVRQLARAGWRFLKALHFDPLAVEQTMFLDSDEYGQPLAVAGTADLIAHVSIDELTALRYHVPALPFGRAVLDWKTSKGLYLEHKIQIAVYAHMAKLAGLVDHVVPGLIVRLPREPGADAHIYCVEGDESELYWSIFRDLVRVYRATKPIYDRERREYYAAKRREEVLNR